MQSDYVALLHRILRALAQADAPTIDNVFTCLVRAQHAREASMSATSKDWHATSSIHRSDAMRSLDRAAQHLWGSYPPEGIRVDNHWHYSVTA